jgi:(2Fe-2S) ferredoxin
LVVYPNGHWYAGVDGEDAIDAILDALKEGGTAEYYLMA